MSYLERTRRFVDNEVLPVATGFRERAEFPWELIEPMAPLGIEGYGCPSMSPISPGLIKWSSIAAPVVSERSSACSPGWR